MDLVDDEVVSGVLGVGRKLKKAKEDAAKKLDAANKLVSYLMMYR